MAQTTDQIPTPKGTMTQPTSPASASPVSENEKLDPPPFKPTLPFLMAFTALAFLTLMVALDATTISPALPKIAATLHGTAIEAFWAGTSFLLASTVFQPNWASFSHIFGRVPVIMTCLVVFLAGVLMAGLSQGMSLLLAGRTMQGVGGGGIIAMLEIVITDLVPLRYRGQWQGVIAAMWSLGSVSGPVIGGAFAQTQWRWIFWLNLPFIGIAGVMVPLFLRLTALPDSIATKLRRIDWSGSAFFVASMTSLLIPLTWGGVMYPWSSWRTLVPLILGAVGVVAFCFYERYVPAEPAIRLSVFANRTANTAFLTTTLHGMILWCLLYYQPLYYQAVKGYTPIVSGVALFPATFTVAPMAVVTGISITKTNSYKWFIYAGWAIAVLGLGLEIVMDVDTSVVQWVFINLVPGVGLGILFPALQFQLQAATSNRDMAFAVAMFTFFRSFGQALGVAVGGTIFQNEMVRKLEQYPQFADRASDLAEDAAALVEIIKRSPAGADKLALRTAYTDSIRVIYIVTLALAAVALVTCVWIKAYPLNVALETEQAFVEKKRDVQSGVERGIDR